MGGWHNVTHSKLMQTSQKYYKVGSDVYGEWVVGRESQKAK
jgi:hypothetical protein